MAIEPIILNGWYPVAVVDDVQDGKPYKTKVLDQHIDYGRDHAGVFTARRADGSACRVATRYHTHWVSLGDGERAFFAIPEFEEADRRIIGAGSVQVHVSGLRAVENFLDMAHFPYVHTGYLGEEPNTEVAEYRIELDTVHDEIFAHDCKFYQPMAAKAASVGIEVSYIYRVCGPFVAILYKTCPLQPQRRDVICLFVQPVSEDWCVGHAVLAYIDDVSTDRDLRLFQQTIFGQDLTILSNHIPRTLPLDAKLEIPTRADAMSTAYRRWLVGKNIQYGTYRQV